MILFKTGLHLKILTNKGQSIVEISLITPVLLIALYIPADFGLAFYAAHLAQNAVREAARIGVSTKDPFDSAASTDTKNEALNRMPTGLTSKTAVVKLYGGGDPNCMQFVEVRADGNYNYFLYQILRLFGASVDNNVTITRTTRMRYEFQPITNNTPCTTATVTSP